MPSRSSSRKRTVKTPQTDAPVSRQCRFDSLGRRVSTRQTPATVPRQKQQTLTQIDFVPRNSRHDDEVDLEYLEAETPQPERERRKTTHGTPALARDNTLTQINFVTKIDNGEEDQELGYIRQDSTLQMEDHEELRFQGLAPRDNSKRTTESRIQKQRKAPRQGNVRPSIYEDIAAHPDRAPSNEIMPPPRTPRKIFKREIESSQSPEGSMISTQSPSPRKRRSPLREMSTNTHRVADRLGVSPKKKAPGLKVEDTFEPSESSSIITQPTLSTALGSRISPFVKTEIEDSEGEDGFDDYDDVATLEQIPQAPEETTSTPPLSSGHQPGSAPGHTSIHDEIEVLESSSSLTPVPSSDPPFPSDISDLPQDAFNSIIPTQPYYVQDLQPKHTPTRSVQQQEPAASGMSNRSSSSEAEPVLPSLPKVPSFVRSESAQASAQLLGDLSRYTQVCPANAIVTETESQYENAFRSLHSSDLPAHPSSDENNSNSYIDLAANDHRAVEPVVSTSQASTVDMTQLTQLTPRVPKSSERTLPTSACEKNPFPPESSKGGASKRQRDDPIILSSSPILTKNAKDRLGGWDGKRLTDSQLLPDSIMNFELPPLGTQDSLGDDI